MDNPPGYGFPGGASGAGRSAVGGTARVRLVDVDILARVSPDAQVAGGTTVASVQLLLAPAPPAGVTRIVQRASATDPWNFTAGGLTSARLYLSTDSVNGNTVDEMLAEQSVVGGATGTSESHVRLDRPVAIVRPWSLWGQTQSIGIAHARYIDVILVD